MLIAREGDGELLMGVPQSHIARPAIAGVSSLRGHPRARGSRRGSGQHQAREGEAVLLVPAPP